MENRKKAYFPKEYHPVENPQVLLENCIVAHTTAKDLAFTPVGKVIDSLRLIEATYSLRLNRPKDFAKAKAILLKSILYN